MRITDFRYITGMIVFALLLTLSVAVNPATAYTKEAAVIAVVDMRMVLRESAAGKDINRQLETQRKKYESEIVSQEKKLKAAEQKLLEQRADLDEQSFNEERNDFERQVIKAQKQVQERKRKLDTALNNSFNKLRAEITQVIAELAKKEGITTVLSRDSVVLAEKSQDITPDVIAALDAKVKKMSVKLD